VRFLGGGVVRGCARRCRMPSSKLHQSSVTVLSENVSSIYTPGGHYKFDVFVLDREQGCTLGEAAKVLIDGVEFPFMHDCTVRDVAFAEDRGFTIRVEDDVASSSKPSRR
jgi:hypothetical protein